MPTEPCVFLILYIHSIYMQVLISSYAYGVFLLLYILWYIVYTCKYGCVFLKLGESIYVTMDLIPILLGSLPLAHNAQYSLVNYGTRSDTVRYAVLCH